jgi:hypothetical protein
MTTHEVMLSHGEKNDGTAFPFWGIAQRAGLGRIALLAGVWFNRQDAKAHLDAKGHRYPKSAFVYCFSGHESWHLKEMYTNARDEQRAKVPEGSRTQKVHWGKALKDPEVFAMLKDKGFIEWVGGNASESKEEQGS